MLSSITPLGERAKGNRFAVTAAAHVIGAALGGATIGMALGAVGAGLADRRSAAVAALVAAVLCAAAALLERVGRLPTWRRQVNEDWLGEYRGTIYGFGYGYQLGMGVVTIVTSPVTYVAWACAVLVGSVAGGVLIGVTFGAGRGLLLLSAARLDTPERLRAFHRRLAAGAPRARMGAAISLAIAAAALAAAGAAS